MKRILTVMALLLVAVSAFAQTGGIKEANLSPELYRTVNGAVEVRNATGSTITANSLVYICGWTELATATVATSPSVRKPKVCLADADVAGARAGFLADNAIANNTSGVGVKKKRLTAVNTNGSTVGNPVYLSSTAGSWTLTAPTPPASVQVVGRVAAVSSTAGIVEFNPDIESLGGLSSVDLAAGGITSSDIGIPVRNASGGLFTAPYIVYLSSWDATTGRFLITGADADADNALGTCVLAANLATATNGLCYKQVNVTGLNTLAAGAVGDPVYLDTTAGGWTLTPPSGADDVVQQVGRVTVDSATVGAIEFNLLDLQIEKIGTNEIQTASITANELAVDSVNASEISAGAVTTTEILDATIANADILANTIQQTKVAVRSRKFAFNEPFWPYLNDISGFPTAAAGENIRITSKDGHLILYLEEQVGAPTLATVYTAVITPSADGMDFGMDDTDNDGIQLGPLETVGGVGTFTAGTDTFYAKATFKLEDASGVDPACLGFRTNQAFADIDALAGLDGYGAAGEEVVALCVGSGAGVDPAVMHTYSKVGGAASVDTTLAAHTWADGATHTLEIYVDTAGAVTYRFDGAAMTGPVALTLSADTFFPFIVHNSSADVNANIYISNFEFGLQ